MSLVLKLIAIIFIIVIIGLFIEFSVNKAHSRISILTPITLTVMKQKELAKYGIKDILGPIVIYNSKNANLEQAMEKIPKSKRNLYYEVPIYPHLSTKITEPFNQSYEEIKSHEAENTPVSFMYKTALGIVDIARDLSSPQKDDAVYRMLIPKNEKFVAFLDGNNIYIK